MKRICPQCNSEDDIQKNQSLWPLAWECPSCDFRLKEQLGFPLLSPELADTISGFDPESFVELFKVESGHFWFRSRNDLIAWLMKRFVADNSHFLEVGCGTGFVLSRMVADNPSLKFSACEIHPKGMSYARQRLGDKVDFFQVDARDLMLERSLDNIGAFDVIEHIKEDEAVLKSFHKALRPDGKVILSVPQHPFLWSVADDAAHHERRYKRGELEEKLEKAGFKIVFSSSFTSLLFPAMAFSRLLSKRQEKGGDKTIDTSLSKDQEFNLSAPLNTLFHLINKVELVTIKLGMRWPVGGSRVIVAQKQ